MCTIYVINVIGYLSLDGALMAIASIDFVGFKIQAVIIRIIYNIMTVFTSVMLANEQVHYRKNIRQFYSLGRKLKLLTIYCYHL